MELTLVIMAAGIGSRYGGVKQLDSVGPSGEAIMDYSIFDAIRCGYTKVVFIIRKELQYAFDRHYETRFRDRIEIEYVYQDEFRKYEEKYTIERTKPWGTAHAMLSTAGAVHTPFAILNADDYYGHEAFQKLGDALKRNTKDKNLFLLGYRLVNTLSEHGTVSRGLCNVNEDGYLIDIQELTKIGRRDGEIVFEENGKYRMLQPGDLVSMNFWGFTPWVFRELDEAFRKFIDENHKNPKAEFYIPTFIDRLIKKNAATVSVLSTDETWLGVTYREDKPLVMRGIRNYIEQGLYPENLS